ncbi:hypothetical protein MUK42_33008 [Musa troglodytarum]|uniref:Uncharacterized protein n=1 Tax=Musa troglodytarum TaxID=320322 RepID=A0A9E7F606_9LILI|nr:hypothetical protein MUK42_33008 [Musa troglodytarum]
MDVAEASALAISLILYLSSTQLVRLWCVCGYHLYGAHMMQLVKDALILNVSLMRLVMLWCLCGYYLCGAHTDPTKFLKEEVPLTGYLIVDYFPYRTTSVGLLVAEASTFAIILVVSCC